MEQRRPLSIRSWLATLAGVAALPLFLVVASLFAWQVRSELADARITALRIARATASRIQAAHDDARQLLTSVAMRPGIRNADGSHCDSLFGIVDFFPQFVTLALFDDRGVLLCAAQPAPEQRLLAANAQAWVSDELHRGTLPVGVPIVRSVDSHWISFLAQRVPSGVLVLVQMPEIVAREALPPKSVITIVDESGTVVARSEDGQRWAGRSTRSAEITRIVLREKHGWTQAVGIDGVSRQYGFTELPVLHAYLYVGVPTATVMQPVRGLLLRGVAGLLLVIVVTFVAALILARAIERPVDTLARSAAAIAREGFASSTPMKTAPVGGPREIALLGETFNAMVANRGEAEAKIVESERNLKALSDRLITVQEEERTRIAREIHDDLGQSLTALKMDVGGLVKLVDSSTDNAVALRDRILNTLDLTVESVQRLSAELRPSVLDDLGLAAALEADARVFEERTGIECDLSVSDELPELERRTATTIYRIVQEALTNVARHSEATRVEIRLRKQARALLLEVRDDGRGIREEELADPKSLGLIGIRERAAIIGGTVSIEGIAARGTIVSVRIPA
ncbi:MAG TPA: histidine kinase [Thermoanaerobaculia bacterium]|nr:histidine kinase [Thermoanaerobaculia bacterium]